MSSTQATMAAKIRSCDWVEASYRERSGAAMSRVGCFPPGSSLASSACSWASVRPGPSRPMTLSERIDGRVLGSSVGTTGSQNCVRSSKSKPGGITPMTV